MPDNSNMEFDIAEVLPYSGTYSYDTGSLDSLFSIRVRSCSAYIDRKDFIARPYHSDIDIPAVGEIVLLLKTFNQYSSNIKTREAWYYVQTVNINSDINDKRLPGLSTSRNTNIPDAPALPGRTLKNKNISPLQPYEGDKILLGRWGNSIRFGSTISTIPENYYHKSPSWKGDVDGDPIIILANGQKNLESKEFVVEDIENDNSSLYLTSTQKIPDEFKFSTTTDPNNINNFNGSNFIGIAERVILRSKTNRTIIDSAKDILFNTPGNVKIGGDTDTTPIPQGDKLVNVLDKIAQILAQGNLVQGSIASPIAKTSLVELNSMITEIKSKNVFIKKNS